jgi:hypothetical protein
MPESATRQQILVEPQSVARIKPTAQAVGLRRNLSEPPKGAEESISFALSGLRRFPIFAQSLTLPLRGWIPFRTEIHQLGHPEIGTQ